MKKSKFTEAQIIGILNEQIQQDQKVAEVCRKHGISEATFYNWRSKYAGMTVDELKRLKELEYENARLKKIVANQSLEIDAIKDLLSKSSDARTKEHGLAHLKKQFRMSHVRACKLVGCSRTKKYYRKRMPAKDAVVKSNRTSHRNKP
ncbi:MAG: transposase [Flammeovirgaceae bacterium]|nr:MAG: transposase [Flammeovirgaceae bacterium]